MTEIEAASMTEMVFDAAALRRVINHSIANHQDPVVVGTTRPDRNAATKTPVKPAVILAKDPGLYLMSNGVPADPVDPTTAAIGYFPRHVVYAIGCDPDRNPDWRERVFDMVGGDDLSLTLEWAEEIRDLIATGARHIVINRSDTEVWLSAK
jgi:Protein of unknown function (DUF3085)